MKQFKPSMKDGMGESKDMSPEAHNEWNDKEGKHSSMPIKDMGVSADNMVPKDKVGPDGFEPGKGPKQGSVKAHEAKQIAKGKGDDGGKSPFPSVKSGGPKTGPMAKAGKGEEGAIKTKAGKGVLNKGNGIKKGAGK